MVNLSLAYLNPDFHLTREKTVNENKQLIKKLFTQNFIVLTIRLRKFCISVKKVYEDDTVCRTPNASGQSASRFFPLLHRRGKGFILFKTTFRRH